MPTPSDPIWHQQREQEIVRHFLALIDDRRFVIDTTSGRKSVVIADRQILESDQSLEVKRRMIDLGSSDHALQRQLPTGRSVDVVLKQRKWWIFEGLTGQARLLCIPPTDALIRGETPTPMTEREVRSALASTPPPTARVPMTIVLFSSAGFSKEARGLADRLAERTVILVEPNDAGGWSVYGTPETQAVLDLLDPEDAEGKRKRIRDAVESAGRDLGQSGLSAEKVATQLQLPLNRVEEEFKRMAGERRGLVAKRFDGRLVIYRESQQPPSGGSTMPIIDKFKSIFSSSNEKKIAFLAERRTQIAQQRDRVQEELHALEQHDGELREQFKKTESPLIKKRVTTQLVQLQKDLERKQQLMQMLNQQSNVVAAHLHSLELIQQGQSIKLPSGEELAEDAAKAEEILAQVQADAELAGELSGGVSVSGMTSEEQAMYEQLMKDSGAAVAAEPQAAPAGPVSQKADPAPAREPAKASSTPKRAEASPG
jgi:hypothetical protein